MFISFSQERVFRRTKDIVTRRLAHRVTSACGGHNAYDRRPHSFGRKLSTALHSPYRHVARLKNLILPALRTGDSLSPGDWATGWMTNNVARLQVRITDFSLLQNSKTSSGAHLDTFKWVQGSFYRG
jgi:hypothetical protein